MLLVFRLSSTRTRPAAARVPRALTGSLVQAASSSLRGIRQRRCHAMLRSIPSKRAPPAQCHPPAQMPCSGPCQACEHPPAQYCTIRQRRCHVQVHAKQASTPVRSTSASFSQLHKQILQGLLLDALEGLEVQWPPIATFARHRLGGVNLIAAAHRPA